MSDAHAAVEAIFRSEYGRVVASLVRRLGDLDRAEEAAAEALVVALETWPRDGVPPSPGGWLTTTAVRRGIDRLRRDALSDDKHRAAAMIHDADPAEDPELTGAVEDDRLRLLFTCCHPALAPEARVALTLRLLGGLSVAEVAQAFLVAETTMAQRITRAKKKIAMAGIPYRVPVTEDLPQRLGGVLAVIYLIFNEGYLVTSGESMRGELTAEAIRLGRVLLELLPAEPEVTGLLALMLLTEARSASRFGDGVLVTLGEQDRSGWDAELVAEGHQLVRECLAINRPGRYQLLAAINAVHTDAPIAAATDWSQILALYDRLLRIDPGPIVGLNRAVVLAELDGPAVGLAEIERPEIAESLAAYHAFHATRADLLRRMGRGANARAAYDAAIALTDNAAERAHLTHRRETLADPQH